MNKRKLALSKELHYGYKVAKACDRVLAKMASGGGVTKALDLRSSAFALKLSFTPLLKKSSSAYVAGLTRLPTYLTKKKLPWNMILTTYRSG